MLLVKKSSRQGEVKALVLPFQAFISPQGNLFGTVVKDECVWTLGEGKLSLKGE